jgi:FlaA1/EpsC-like NDP-sugar epimerase
MAVKFREELSAAANFCHNFVSVSMSFITRPIVELRPLPAMLANTGAIEWSRFLDRPVINSTCFDCDAAVAGKTVLITGAAGSIGSALARRLMEAPVDTLLLLDCSLPGLQALCRKYVERLAKSPRVEFLQTDILSEGELQDTFLKHRPQIVFHTAALKHLAALERAPVNAIKTNVLGTLRLLELVDSSDVECFVNISTDKAVNPISILGVSKRIAELLVLSMESSGARMVSLRLGNVLGSSGSVVPLFLRSLQNNQPLKITDPQASRYFVTMDEAVSLLLASLAVSDNSLLLPAMGAPRRIGDLAAFLLNEFQCVFPDKSLTVTGLRDGEKRAEQLLYQHEYLGAGPVPHLRRILNSRVPDRDEFAENVGRLLELIVEGGTTGLIEALSRIVPEFAASPALQSYLR